jgi:DNA helicase-2/ATP-dependent DNA helicase PcrA
VCGGSLATAAEKKTARCAQCPATYDEALFEALKAWRLERSRGDSVPAYVVFTDATLELIAEVLPRDPAALRRISGVGAAKIDKYGDDVLAVVAGHGS